MINKNFEELGRKREPEGNEYTFLFQQMYDYINTVELPANCLAIEKLKYEGKDYGY